MYTLISSAFIVCLLQAAALINAEPPGMTTNLDLQNPISGEATYYDEWASPMVSCNPQKCPEDGFCAALPMKYMNQVGSTKESCGKCVKVVYESKAIVLRVMDSCPGCGENKLDFSVPAFKALMGGLEKGRVQVKWAFVPCDGSAPASGGSASAASSAPTPKAAKK
jgi:expansin (peptidoglycan-binding protein)